jgi:hypothetical protein
MMTLKTEALFHARKLCRSLGSAPDARQRVREIISTLLHGEGWSPADEKAIMAFTQWVDTRPSVALLKSQCEALLTSL